ncbi:MAG: VTT domain-containing protein [archaeon]
MDWKKPLLFIFGIIAYIGLFFLLYELFLDRNRIIDLAGDGGVLGPAIIVALFILQAVVFFLPGNVVTIASGYLFGFWGALFLNFFGSLLGTALLFILARRASRFFGYSKLVLAELDYIKQFFKKARSRRKAYVLTRAAPMVPGDTVTVFVASFTKNSFWEFMFFVAIGSVPKTVLDTFAGTVIREYGLISYPFLWVFSFLVLLLIADFLIEKKKGLVQKIKLPWKV